MRKRNLLWCVYASVASDEPYQCLFETTKKEKAYKYLHKVVLKDSRYVKAYITSKPIEKTAHKYMDVED